MEPFVLYSTRPEIRRIDIRTKAVTVVVQDAEDTIGIEFDWLEKRVYWSDITKDRIRRAFFNGSDVQDIITTGMFTTEGESTPC